MDIEGGGSGKESICQCRRCKRHGFNSWVRIIPWSKKWQPTLNILAWKIPWTEEPGGLQFMGLQRVWHDWVTSLYYYYYLKNYFLVVLWLLLLLSSSLPSSFYLAQNIPWYWNALWFTKEKTNFVFYVYIIKCFYYNFLLVINFLKFQLCQHPLKRDTYLIRPLPF